jgi:predicted secreted Zn-dependent protease
VRTFIGLLLPAAMLGLSPASAQDAWQPVEKVEPYTIAGTTPPELYASIREHGPEIGKGRRTIAHTNFRLTWPVRDYQRRGNACVIAAATPRLIITYTLPKPLQKLPDATRARWEPFIAGLAAHEKVHGEYIIDMVRQIVAYSVGLTVEDDPGCKKIRTVLTARLSELSQEQRRKGRDFDLVEMANGGNIQQLVLRLLNGV